MTVLVPVGVEVLLRVGLVDGDGVPDSVRVELPDRLPSSLIVTETEAVEGVRVQVGPDSERVALALADGLKAAVSVGERVGVEDGVRVDDPVRVTLPVDVAAAVGVGLREPVGVGLGEGGDRVPDGDRVRECVGVARRLLESVWVGVRDGLAVREGEWVTEGVWDSVGDGELAGLQDWVWDRDRDGAEGLRLTLLETRPEGVVEGETLQERVGEALSDTVAVKHGEGLALMVETEQVAVREGVAVRGGVEEDVAVAVQLPECEPLGVREGESEASAEKLREPDWVGGEGVRAGLSVAVRLDAEAVVETEWVGVLVQEAVKVKAVLSDGVLVKEGVREGGEGVGGEGVK